MKTFVQQKGTCGTTFTIPGSVPVLDTKSTCTVPKGNFVQLGGSLTNAAGPVWYSWDRVDPGAANYNDLNVPRFVPRFPTQRSAVRFLPNMYLITTGLGTQKEEIPPKATVAGDNPMTFRFIARTRFDPATSAATAFDAALSGTFGYKDMALTYKKSEAPLTIISAGALVTNQQTTVTWTGATGLTNQVELLIAPNTMSAIASDAFKYETDIVDLVWTSLGVFPNNGAATATVPTFANPNSNPVVLMVRSKDSNDAASNNWYVLTTFGCFCVLDLNLTM